jgi:environmental stress-induced protein Ves
MFRLLDPADYTSMPWKNGGGRTTEIATHPPGAALDAFLWRVSIADVASDGPFSHFPGVDRTIVLLDGAGMWLASRGREKELRTPFEPYRFSGDDAVDCTLIAGPVRDFNAMFRRGVARGSVTVVRGDPAEIVQGDFVLAYAATGTHDFAIPGHPPRVLDTGHAVLVERPADGEFAPIVVRPARNAVALVVRVDIP